MKLVLQVWNLAAAIGLFVFLQSRMERISDKRLSNILVAFATAGILSFGLTIAFYEIYPAGLRATLSAWELTYSIGVVGLVEEGAKFLAFMFAVRAGETIREPQDGVIQAAAVGITFGAIENIFYIFAYDGFFMWLRPILTTGGHGVYAAIWGALYARSVYANSVGIDPGARRGAALGVPLVAILHGLYNAATAFYPAALALDVIALIIAIGLFRKLVELSPYRIYPLEKASQAIPSIRRGLAFNPRSPVLNRNIGIYLMHLGRYRAASRHLRASVPRSRDPRRAQFLAAACEQSFLPSFFARRAIRIAWSRLDDRQRQTYWNQLVRLVGDESEIVSAVTAFIESAFQPRRYRNTRDIARASRIRRAERRHWSRSTS